MAGPYTNKIKTARSPFIFSLAGAFLTLPAHFCSFSVYVVLQIVFFSKHFGSILEAPTFLEAFLEAFWKHFGSIWQHFGTVLEAFWERFGSVWALL